MTVTYEDPLGHDFSETMTVGYSPRINMVHRTRSDLSDIHKRLEEIVKEMSKWTVRGSGIMVRTRADLRREDGEIDEYYEREAALAREHGDATKPAPEGDTSQEATSEADSDDLA